MKYLILIAALFASNAFALGLGNDNSGTGIANQSQGQNQGQAQGQLQGQAQAATAVSGAAAGASVISAISNDTRAAGLAYAGGGANSLTINEAAIPTNTIAATYQEIKNSDYTIKNVPSFATGNVYPTAPCMGSSTVGGAGVGFGFSIGSSWTDDECGLRETARSFSGMGLKDDALAILCTSTYAKAAPSCAARAQPK